MTEPEDNVALQVADQEEPDFTETRYMLIVTELIAKVDELTAAIPDLVYPGAESRKFVRRKVGVPRRFVRRALSLLMNAQGLEMVRDMDGGTSLDIAQYIDAFQTLKSRFRTAFIGLSFTLQMKEAELISRMQAVYGVTRALARDSANLSLIDTAQQLRSARRRPRKRRRTKKPAKD